jgi:hypothetical protein
LHLVTCGSSGRLEVLDGLTRFLISKSTTSLTANLSRQTKELLHSEQLGDVHVFPSSYWLAFGFSTSVNASPNKFQANPHNKIVKPGKMVI